MHLIVRVAAAWQLLCSKMPADQVTCRIHCTQTQLSLSCWAGLAELACQASHAQRQVCSLMTPPGQKLLYEQLVLCLNDSRSEVLPWG